MSVKAAAVAKCLAAFVLLLAAGCGNAMELKERAFVLGAALDLTDANRIKMTSQLYGAGKSDSESLRQGSFVNIITFGHTLGEASRDIPLHIGRKAQWGHTQMLFVGESLARSEKFTDILDFFFRDDEPRLSIRISITEGDASGFLEKTAVIENSISRQARNIQHFSLRYSGKTAEVNLLELLRAMSGKSATTVIPYVRNFNHKQDNIYYSGGAIIENGKMTGLLTPTEMQTYLMLNCKFKGGNIVMPCPSLPNSGDSYEIRSVELHKKIRVDRDPPEANYNLVIDGSIRELRCSDLSTPDSAQQFQSSMSELLLDRFEVFVDKFQKQGIDLLGINSELYTYEPDYWTAWRSRSSRAMPEIDYRFDINVRIVDTGSEQGRISLKN